MILKKRLEDSEFSEAWEETKLEYLLVRNILKRRKNLGKTQSKLAKRTRTAQSTISRINAGNSKVTLRMLGELAKALDTTVHYLITDESSNTELAQVSV
ncbi:helix-turn-helix domain-containing protein [Solibacillus cecembensis]|uniref:helix-turn-helix domain-containing protein n=1 Tax=Solibacillus cecembensis TaxID=459347 RepID=UPI003D06B17D